MGIFSKKEDEKKPGVARAGLNNTEIEVIVKRKDGSLKAYRKVVNQKEVKKIDK